MNYTASMRTVFFVSFVVVSVIWSGAVKSTAQPQQQPNVPDRSIVPILGDRISSAVYSLPTDDPSLMQLAVFYSFGHDAITFVKPTKSAILKNFISPVIITIEIRDSTGIIRHAKDIVDTISCDTFEQTISSTLRTSGAYTVMMKRSDYIVSIDMQQQNSTIRKFRIPIAPPNPSEGMFASQMIIASGSSGEKTITPIIMGQALPFSGTDARFILPTVRTNESDVITYTIRRRQVKSNDGTEQPILANGSARLRKIGRLAATSTPLNGMIPTITWSEISTQQSLLCIDAVVPTSLLQPGEYDISFQNISTRDSAVFPFAVLWNDMPISYRSMRVALDYMQYIVSESEYDALRDGNEREVRKNLEAWWKAKDPSPRTAYNEQMVEFFRRCDYAKLAFSNYGLIDGAKTERGKIHILYGFPTKISQGDSADKPRETWRYENKVKMQFTFEITTSGVFKLVKVEEI